MKKLDRIAELINSEFNLHPKAQLQDYYKLFFQDAFGPGHIIKDKTSAEKYLRIELEEASNFEEKDFQNISSTNSFYRVNINVINKELISFENLLDAFIKSAKIENEISSKEWLEEWGNIEQQILLMKIPMENIEKQSTELWKIIRSEQLISHSSIYRKTYSPHYRLINAEQFSRIKC